MSYLKYALLKNFVKKPAYMVFFVTDKCNSRCKHCFNWNLNKKSKDLTLREINNFSKQLNTIEWVTMSGGEPFLRKDLPEICKIFLKNNKTKQITIPTNGLSPKLIYQTTKKILSLPHKFNLSINLSLDGLEKTHDKIRGIKGSFKKVSETYELLKTLKNNKKFSLKANTTISNINYKEIKQLNKHIRENMPLVDSHNFELIRGNPKDKDFSLPSLNEIYKLKKDLHSIWDNNVFFPDSKIKSKTAKVIKKHLFDLYTKIIKTKKQLIPCYAGKFHMVLGATGDLFFCELLPKIGNIRKNNFNKIWYSEQAKKQRESIKKKKCFCYHSCFQNANLIFNFKSYPRILSKLFN